MCISCLFANDLLLFIFILDYGNYARQKKQILAIFLFEFKMGYKASGDNLQHPQHTPAQELLMNTQCTGSAGSFAKDKSLEDEV